MKTKKIRRKLTLNWKTIANLNNNELNNVRGGYIMATATCGPLLCTCVPPPEEEGQG